MLFFIFFILFIIYPCNCKHYATMYDVDNTITSMFHYHIKSHELTEDLLKRWINNYITKFDKYNIYLIKSDLPPLTPEIVKEIFNQIKKRDYSFFDLLDRIFKDAIIRSQKMRLKIIKDIYNSDESYKPLAKQATTLKELEQNIRRYLTNTMVVFKRRFNLKNRAKFLAWINKKFVTTENMLLNLDNNNVALQEKSILNNKVIRILKAFALSLDPHSLVFTQSEAKETRALLTKSLPKFGLILTDVVNKIVITDTVPNSTAAKAGIYKDAILIQVDELITKKITYKDLIKYLSDHNNVTLTIQHPTTKQRQTIILKKKNIPTHATRYYSEKCGDGIIGIIQMDSFYDNKVTSSAKDCKNAILALQKKGNLKGIILDLRSNGGGLLHQAVEVAKLFMASGVVIAPKYKNSTPNYIRSMQKEPLFDGHLILLTSKATASASEIVAMAVQDYGLGLVVGDLTTMGKGSIQLQTVTDKHANVCFTVTAGTFFSVAGRSPQKVGIKCDIHVPSKFAPFKMEEKYLPFCLEEDSIKPSYDDELNDVTHYKRALLISNYLKHKQRKRSIYGDMIDSLKKRSESRCQKNAIYKTLMDKIATKEIADSPLLIDDYKEADSFQLTEALNIMKDILQGEQKESSTKERAKHPVNA